MAIILRDAVRQKLREKHQVAVHEVAQCFRNATGRLLVDTREQHRTHPPTLWFIAPTDRRRLLKICYVPLGSDQEVKTAFEPNAAELHLYRVLGRPVDF